MGKTTDDILAKIGCKNTKSRKAVIEVLENAENPLSAEDIFLCIKNRVRPSICPLFTEP